MIILHFQENSMCIDLVDCTSVPQYLSTTVLV